MRRQLKRLVTSIPQLSRLADRITGRLPKVLVYHRFAAPGTAIPHRMAADEFGWQLDTIKKKFDVITFGACVQHFLDKGRWPEGCVVLTVDDGYRDMFQWAWPELERRRLSATFFVTSGFVDGQIWLWPDQLEYALERTRLGDCSVSMAGRVSVFPLCNSGERATAWRICTRYCIGLGNADRLSFIREFCDLLEVELPPAPPAGYAAASWQELRCMQQGGIEIGGHTVRHPILSKVEPEQLDSEIADCRRVLEERLATPITSFCYPNSGPGDINQAVLDAVARAGYRGAVFGTNLAAWDRYQVPRIGVSEDRVDFLWKLCGGEAMGYHTRRARTR